ncbi:hypothetical protein AGLY_017196 [Aphis glycines]|uniref:Uncharacterized protein n=1 Tax=Aphis glycines TaxID=307491 RepID=A0A6G0SVR3_APHGL|nr:hypothetical protein AGLY_017196 [Aphis glycines]
MENILCEDYSVKKHLVNIKHQLLNVDSEHNKKNMNSVIPSPTKLEDYKHAYINHLNENSFMDDNICRESDESDEYDSDCSLGSLNSLYLRLKSTSKVIDLNITDRVGTKQLQPIFNLNKTDGTPGNSEIASFKPKNDKHMNISHSNDNICCESDSDCSLRSSNSLCLKLKNCSTINKVSTKQLHDTICKLNKTGSFPENNDAKETNASEKIMAYNKTKPIMKLSTTIFYGKQKSTSQYPFTRLSHEYSFKTKSSNSKILNTRNLESKLKYCTNKSRISKKKPKQRKYLSIQKTLSTSEIFWENKYSIRSQLKEPVPLLQFSIKSIKKKVNSLTNTTENQSANEIDFINYEHLIKKEDNLSLEFSYVENQLNKSNNFFVNDFMDTDDFGGTKEIENIIQKLFDNDDSFIDNATNKWWTNDRDYEDDDEIQDEYFLLFKQFNN